MKTSKIKICIVSSSGGHLLKCFQLSGWWKKHNRFWVTQKDDFTQSILNGEKMYFANFPDNRNIKNAFRNLFLAYNILSKEKPDVVFSMGAGIAPPFLLAAKTMGIKTIFMETFITIPQATLSGKMLYPFVDHFFVQNPKLKKTYKNSLYKGNVFNY